MQLNRKYDKNLLLIDENSMCQKYQLFHILQFSKKIDITATVKFIFDMNYNFFQLFLALNGKFHVQILVISKV